MMYDFDWSELAFSDKKPLRSLKASFILAPRELSSRRFIQMAKQYLPAGPIVLGLAKESFIDGFNGQLQFRTLQQSDVQAVIDNINDSKSPHKMYSLHYFQREADTIISKLRFRRIVLVNGSWQFAFHNRSTYYLLANSHIDFQMVSPFNDEEEARAYEQAHWQPMLKTVALPATGQQLDEAAILEAATSAAKLSYDYNFQTGAALGKRIGQHYELLAWAYNHVVPYQTHAMHYGAAREVHFSPPHDLNYYDTVHAETELIIKAQRENISFHGATLFINLLPCPACARMLSRTDIAEVVYRHDHSDGYAVKLLESAGKRVRRVVG